MTISIEQRYRELEDAGAAKRALKAKRQPLILIALVNVLTLAVALTAVADLRRLRTPEGTALTWTQAALFGDCNDYVKFSVADASGHDRRSRAELCQDLRSATAPARNEVQQTGLTLGGVRKDGATAEVSLTIHRKNVPTAVTVHLVKGKDGWRVLRDQLTCGSVGCA